MFGFGFATPYASKTGDGGFSPLGLSPTFWFDFSKYSTGAYSGAEVDETGTTTLTPINGALSASDGTNQAYKTNDATQYALNYGSSYFTTLRNAHTQIFLYKPNTLSPASPDALCGVLNSSGTYGYNIWRRNNKLRLYIRLNGVDQVFDTTSDVITTTDYYYILVEVQQSGVRIEVNGVNLLLDNSTFTESLLSLVLNADLYIGARNKASTSTIDILSDGCFGDHILIPRVLTSQEKTNLLNYFV